MKNKNQTQLWGKNFIIASSINLLVMFIYYLLLVTIGSFTVEQFGASNSMSGLVTGMMVMGCLFGRFVTGYFIGIIGCNKVLFVGVVSFIITMALYLLAFNLLLLIICKI